MGVELLAVAVLAVVKPPLFKLTVVRFCEPNGIPPVELVSRVDVVPGCAGLALDLPTLWSEVTDLETEDPTAE